MLSPRVTAARHVSRAGEGWLTGRAWEYRGAWGSASGSPRASRGVRRLESMIVNIWLALQGQGTELGAAGAAVGMQSPGRPCSARGWSPGKLGSPGRHPCIRECVQCPRASQASCYKSPQALIQCPAPGSSSIMTVTVWLMRWTACPVKHLSRSRERPGDRPLNGMERTG